MSKIVKVKAVVVLILATFMAACGTLTTVGETGKKSPSWWSFLTPKMPTSTVAFRG